MQKRVTTIDPIPIEKNHADNTIQLWPYSTYDTGRVNATDIELLQRSEANLNAILNHADSGYVLYDANLQIIAFNELAQQLSKTLYSKRLADGSHLLSYFPKERHEVLLDITKKVLNGEKISYEMCFHIDGFEKWIEVKWLNVKNAENKNWGFILASKDITESKLAAIEKEKITTDLIRRNKALEQFANVTSHNLRAPVANIINLIQMMDLADNETEKMEMIGFILESSHNLNRIISDIHYILEVKQHINELKENINLSALVKDIKISISNIIVKEQVVIHCDFGGAEDIFSIRSFLHNILYNLILNSIKYRSTNRAPEIAITAKNIGNNIKITVADNGKGIDLHKHGNSLFGLYKRFDNTVEGSGLGLFMVRSQVEDLGGKITAESELGIGTKFIIEFPITEQVPK